MEESGSDVAPTGKHWFLVALFALLILGSTIIPLYHGQSLANGRVFTGSGYDTVDHGYYLSIMQQGANGAWKMTNLYTTEQQPPLLIHTFYLMSGKVAAATGLSMPVAYHVMRLIVGLALIFAVWAFLRRTLSGLVAAVALGFVFASSGLGWLPMGWDILSVDLWLAEANTYLTMYYWPHITYALLLKTGAILCIFFGSRPFRARFAVLAGVCSALLVFDHTFGLVGIAFTYLVYLAATYFMERKLGRSFEWKPWLSFFGITLAVALPAILLMLEQVRSNSGLSNKMGLQVEPVPGLISMLSGFGFLLPLCLIPLFFHFRGITERQENFLPPLVGKRALLFLYAWAGSNFFSVYVFQSQWFARRMILGAHIPIAILAAIGLVMLLRQIQLLMPKSTVAIAGFGAVALTAVTQVVVLKSEVDGYERGTARNCRFYIEQQEVEALTALGKAQPPDVVIQPIPGALQPKSHDPTTMLNGPYIPDLTLLVYGPWLTQHHEVVGHPWETPGFDQKMERLMGIADRQGPGILLNPEGL